MDTIVSAIFTGEDGSLGYKRGDRYDLRIVALPHPWLNYRGSQIQVMRLDMTGVCPYRNIVTFLQNWDHIDNSWIQVKRY